MAYTDDLLELMPDTLTHASWTGMSTDGYGHTTYSTASTTYPCRVVTGQRLIRNFDGVEDVATTTVWVASTSTFSALDKFTLPGGTAPVLLSIETFRDEDGVTHSKLGFGD